MKPLVVQVDAFTSEPFSGNPAAVVLWPARAHDTHAGAIPVDPFREDWMQSVADEMNLAETAFLHRQTGDFGLRWFTPTCEVDLCGHATLAAAHVLWETGALRWSEPAVFDTRSGRLSAHHADGWISLDVPAEPVEACDAPFDLPEALGTPVSFVGRNRFDLLVEVESPADLRAMTPNHDLLTHIPGRGVIVTAASDDEAADYLCRFFAPRVGIPEDPVTGSAQCALGPYWQKRLGKTDLTCFQASRRGGWVRVSLDHRRVILKGQAVTVMRGELSLL